MNTILSKIISRKIQISCFLYKIYLKQYSQIIFSELHLDGIPIIDIRKGSKLILGKNVRLGSRNSGYHLNMHGPVKLFADHRGAVIKVGDNTRIHGSCIHAFSRITIGKNCLIAANCQIMDASGHDLSFDDVANRINTSGSIKPVIIQDSVWLGVNTIILPGVTIGQGAVIAAGSVVVKDIPPMVLAAGNPAKVISTHKDT